MTGVSDLMQAMAAAGAPLEAIIIAVRALEAKDEAIEARRSNDRERKRRQRANVTSDGTVAGQSRDAGGTVTDETPSLDKSPQTPKINPTPPDRDTRATHIREGWTPDALPSGSIAEQIVTRWEPGRIERELSKFRDHWAQASGQTARKRDWQAAWRKWIGNADEYRGRTASRTPKPDANEERFGRTIAAAFDAFGGEHGGFQ